MSHIPVLLQEVIQILDPKKGMTVADGTLGTGGHARALIPLIMPGGKFVGIDWDKDLLSKTKKVLSEEFSQWTGNMHFIHGNYADAPALLNEEGLQKVDRMVVDLGYSSWHLSDAKRGFSFQSPEVLDMRYDTSAGTPAYEVINSFTAQRLADIFLRYGEERYSRRIAKAIVDQRKQEKILTADTLRTVIKKATPASYKKSRIDPATRTFQALRIYVNHELDNVQRLLEKIPKIIQPKGRIIIISFHSMEDRLVKHHFKHLASTGNASLIMKKPVVPSEEEVAQNPRSRSAKLRSIELN